MNILYVFGCVLSVAVVVSATPTKQCEGYNFDGLSERITVNPCQKSQCRLPKEQNITVTFRFKSAAIVKSLKNDVNAIIGGIPLPFIGVTGTSACANIYHEDGTTPAPCPLEANKEYVYSNAFYVENFYPEVGMIVRWSLNDGDKFVICFEVPATIVKKKRKDRKVAVAGI